MSRQSKVVPLVTSAVSIGIVVILASVALVVAPPSPPGIAEFAPQAVTAIQQAPPNQTSQFGSNGVGKCATGLVCAGSSPKPTPSVKPSASKSPTAAASLMPSSAAASASASAGPSASAVISATPKASAAPSATPVTVTPAQLACYSWPDGSVTQTLDPQSPPCVASFDGSKGNGGATSPGVTASTITVADPGYDPTDTGTNDLVTFINTHYQLYGRTIKLVPANLPQTYSNANDPGVSQTVADEVIQANPFATLSIDTNFGDEQPQFRAKVTGAKIVYVGNGSGTITTGELASYAPYAWSYQMAADTTLRNLGQLICSSVVGKNATWSPQTTNDKRKFVLLVYAHSGAVQTDTTPLTDALSACNTTPAKTIDFDFDANSNTPDTQLQLQMQQLQQAGDTSIIEVGDRSSLYHAFSAANGVGYQPEWLVPGISKTYFDIYGNQQSMNESTHLVGLATDSKKIPYTSQPWFEAITSADPSYVYPTTAAGGYDSFYKPLALLAAGIQAAGPNLTPQSFSSGLSGTVFPDPGKGASPSWQSTVGISPGGHTFTQDLGVWWVSATQQSSEVNGGGATQPGGMCWVDRGSRFQTGGWPATVAPFTGACR